MEKTKPKVKIYTDGACQNNPGKGGWGAVLIYEDKIGKIHQKTYSKGYKMTTNNRMELTAVIEALNLLKMPCKIELYSDSKYVIDAINKKWLDNWVQKNWKSSSGKVKNIDLWEKFLIASKPHDIRYIWVKGHAQNEYNNLCDKMAVEAREKENLEIDEQFKN